MVCVIGLGDLITANETHLHRFAVTTNFVGQLDIFNRTSGAVTPRIRFQLIGDLELRQFERTGAVIADDLPATTTLTPSRTRFTVTVNGVAFLTCTMLLVA